MARSRPLEMLPWIALGAVMVAVYAPILAELWRDWMRDPNYSHGVLVPVISGFLIWRQRKTLAALPRRPAILGLVGVLGSVALLLVGTAGAEVFTQRVSLLAFMASSVLFLLGWRWLRATAFPLAFLLLAIPLPYVLYYTVTNPMQAVAAKFAVIGLRGAGVPVVAQGNILHLPDSTTLEVAEACSGIRSLYAFFALGALMAYSMPVPSWVRVLVFLATIPLSVAANAFRVWASSLGAYIVGPEVTKGFVHEMFGLLVFSVALGLFFLVRHGVRKLWRSAS